MTIDPALLELSRVESVEVDLADLISSDVLAADAVLQNEPPQWLLDDIAEHRLRLYQEARGRWFLGPLDE